jgi:AcrR family transcriptional regulator
VKPRVVTTARKRPRQERSKETVDALMQAAARVLIDNGYDKTTTNRIAEAAGVSIGSLYQYFPNKESLVAELIRRQAEAEFAVFVERMLLVRDLPLRKAISEFIVSLIAAHRVRPKLHKVLMEQVPRVGAFKHVRDVERRVGEFLRVAVEERRHEIRPRNLDQAAFVLQHAVEAVTHAAVLDEPKYLEDDKLVHELTELVMRYLSP